MIVGYGRVSCREQWEDGSLEQQKDRLRKAGASEILVDVESGTKDSRPNYQRLQELIETHGDRLTVIVTRLDRLTRSLVELRRFIKLIEKTGTKLIALDDHIDLTTSAGRFQLNMLGALAEMESDRMGERIRHGHAYRRSQGKLSPGYAPFGYKRENGDRLIPDHEKVVCFEGKEWSRWELARLRVELIKEKGSLHKAAMEYNKRLGVMPVKGRDHLARLVTSRPGLSNWIRNPVLRGILTYGRSSGSYEEHAGKIEPLISYQEWEEIHSILEANNKKQGGSGSRTLLLAGLIRCADCGGTFGGRYRATKSGESCKYRCHRRNDYGGCENKGDISEGTILQAIAKELREKAGEIWESDSLTMTVAIADPEQQKLAEQIKALKKMEANPIIEQAITQLEQSLKQLVNERTINDSLLVERREEIKQVFADPKFWEWLEKRPDDMRRTLRRYVKAVWIKSREIVRIELKV